MIYTKSALQPESVGCDISDEPEDKEYKSSPECAEVTCNSSGKAVQGSDVHHVAYRRTEVGEVNILVNSGIKAAPSVPQLIMIANANQMPLPISCNRK